MARANNIVFENLRAEMARKQLSISEMAKYLNVTRDTLGYKLSGKRPINLDEALRIARKFFPERDVYYLFRELIPEDGGGDGSRPGERIA